MPIYKFLFKSPRWLMYIKKPSLFVYCYYFHLTKFVCFTIHMTNECNIWCSCASPFKHCCKFSHTNKRTHIQFKLDVLMTSYIVFISQFTRFLVKDRFSFLVIFCCFFLWRETIKRYILWKGPSENMYLTLTTN